MSKTISKVWKNAVGGLLTQTGLALDRLGCQLQYNHEYIKEFPRYRTLFPIECSSAIINSSDRIAHMGSLVGQVELEGDVIVGQGSILKGDSNPIRVGNGTIIGDYVTFLTELLRFQIPGSINIGNNVIIGDKAVLKSCVIDDGAFIGEGVFIQEGAVVERNAIILAFSVVPAGAIVKANAVWGGDSVKMIREASREDIDRVENERAQRRQYYDQVDQGQVFLKF